MVAKPVFNPIPIRTAHTLNSVGSVRFYFICWLYAQATNTQRYYYFGWFCGDFGCDGRASIDIVSLFIACSQLRLHRMALDGIPRENAENFAQMPSCRSTNWCEKWFCSGSAHRCMWRCWFWLVSRWLLRDWLNTFSPFISFVLCFSFLSFSVSLRVSKIFLSVEQQQWSNATAAECNEDRAKDHGDDSRMMSLSAKIGFFERLKQELCVFLCAVFAAECQFLSAITCEQKWTCECRMYSAERSSHQNDGMALVHLARVSRDSSE